MDFNQAQAVVKTFAESNNWSDEPCIDKFDHVHEELTELSKLFRYKKIEERKKVLVVEKEKIEQEYGDLLFAVIRLGNQLEVDATTSFEEAAERIKQKYLGRKEGKA